MTKTNSAIGISAAAFLACASLGVACGPGSDSSGASDGSAGNSANGIAGAPGFGGHPGSGGSPGFASAGGRTTAGESGAGGFAGAHHCTQLPSNPLLTDFSPASFKATDGSSWTAGKADLWGSAPSTLTGGDEFYQGKRESAAKVTLHGQSLTVSATIAAGDYAGYTFNFKPACTNASSTQGLQFDVLEGSTLGNATLKVQMQQKSDYSSTANPGTRPGDCSPTNVETPNNDCSSPVFTVASSGASLSTGMTQLAWTSFAGGKPVATVDSSQLMAIQWQFECPPDGGTVSAAGGSGGAAGGGRSSSGGASVGGSGTSGGGGTAGLAGGGSHSGGSGGGFGLGGATAGTGGQSGLGGGSGASGTAGTVGGSSGSSGSNGSAGSSGVAGYGGRAGSGGTAGTGSSKTPPCVIFFTLDNVTFY